MVELRRDDLVEVVLEVDPQLKIKAAGVQVWLPGIRICSTRCWALVFQRAQLRPCQGTHLLRPTLYKKPRCMDSDWPLVVVD